jgi:hypothetical protein
MVRRTTATLPKPIANLSSGNAPQMFEKEITGQPNRLMKGFKNHGWLILGPGVKPWRPGLLAPRDARGLD